MINLPQEYLERMKGQVSDFDGFLKSYDLPPAKGIRVNTLIISVEDFKKISPFGLEPIPWESSAFYVNCESPGKTVHHAAGLYYVQEPSATVAAPKLEVNRGERVLDLCSAPGGKGTQLAQAMQGEGVLVLNEINFSRCAILRSNVERLGVKNAIITSKPPEVLAESITEYFDKILVDAPCSGEGMFKKEDAAIREWSLKNVSACAERQTKILKSADKMLACGGRLVYSTCTFAPEEDEWQIENFLKSNPGYKLLEMNKLLPHEVRGEGHFYAVLQKRTGERRNLDRFRYGALNNGAVNKYFQAWADEALKVKFNNLFQTGNAGQTHLYSLPDDMPSLGYGPVCAGIQLATVNAINGKVEPSHSLAMCLKKGEANFIELDEQTALKYLRGQTFDCDTNLKGWHVAAFCGYPLGWCKAVGGVAKNHLPKGLRI